MAAIARPGVCENRMRLSAPSSSKWPARIARPWRCLAGLGEPPGTELLRRWRPRRHACCAPTPPRLKRYGACARLSDPSRRACACE